MAEASPLMSSATKAVRRAADNARRYASMLDAEVYLLTLSKSTVLRTSRLSASGLFVCLRWLKRIEAGAEGRREEAVRRARDRRSWRDGAESASLF